MEPKQSSRRRWVAGFTIGFLLLLLGALIYAGTLQLREKVRAQITHRDGEILQAVAMMHQIMEESAEGLGAEIESFADQFNLALQVSQLNQGIVGTRLYDTNGLFLAAFPAHVLPAPLPNGHFKELSSLRPISRYHAALPLRAVIGERAAAERTAPLLVVEIPLYRQTEQRLLGVVQFVIDGADIATEFAELDRHLAWQAGVAFAAGALVMVLILVWAFNRLERSSRLLLEKTNRLQQVNAELVRAAKTSAVGSVTAHLVHGLSSPLAGLKDFLASRAQTEQEDWGALAETTRRMESLVHDLIHFLSEEQSPHYEVSVADLLQNLRLRQEAAARRDEICLKMSQAVDGVLDNRQANILLLILDQLVENAIQVTPPGKTVELRIEDGPEEGIRILIADQGPGFPDHLRQRLFTPCRSTKPEGHGLGLAITKHLADHLGAGLALVESTASGCMFEVVLPRITSKAPLAAKIISG